MKNPYEVLRAKEQEIVQVRKEMEALLLAASLIGSDEPLRSNVEASHERSRVLEMP
jgi:hypothetical protein